MSEDRGFTLVEIMFVIIVLGILVALAIASFTMSSTSAERVACRQNQRILESAAARYSVDHDGDVPLVMDDLVPYVKNMEKAKCCPANPTVELRFGMSPKSVVCPSHPKG